MCGVIAYFSPKPSKKHTQEISDLFEQSKIRGLHSFGFSARINGKIQTFKEWDLKKLQEKIVSIPKFDLLVGHTRYSTSGDFKDHSNNQPIDIPGIALAFNGVITQASKEEYEKTYGKQYVTENDGEIFARKVLDGEDWEEFVFDGSFSFAGAFISKKGAYALRNPNRPLWMLERSDARFLASTKNIFERASLIGSKEIQPGVVVDLCSTL